MKVAHLYLRSRHVSIQVALTVIGLLLLTVAEATVAIPLSRTPVATLILWLIVPSISTLLVLATPIRYWDRAGRRSMGRIDAAFILTIVAGNHLIAAQQLPLSTVFVSPAWPLAEIVAQLCITVGYIAVGSRGWIGALLLMSFLIIASSDPSMVDFINAAAESRIVTPAAAALWLVTLGVAVHPSMSGRGEQANASVF